MYFDDEPAAYHDVALVCLNGHMVNDRVRDMPQFNKKFCDRCGEPTIDTCPNCKTPIQGDYKSGVVVLGPTPVRSFCHQCGKPFPWTE